MVLRSMTCLDTFGLSLKHTHRLNQDANSFVETIRNTLWIICGFFLSCVCQAFVSVHCCLVVSCWERADLLAIVCDV